MMSTFSRNDPTAGRAARRKVGPVTTVAVPTLVAPVIADRVIAGPVAHRAKISAVEVRKADRDQMVKDTTRARCPVVVDRVVVRAIAVRVQVVRAQALAVRGGVAWAVRE